MSLVVYICAKCLFSFERIGSVDTCPDCGSVNIRQATDEEKSEYLRVRAEMNSNND